jgi:hypothetical protein
LITPLRDETSVPSDADHRVLADHDQRVVGVAHGAEQVRARVQGVEVELQDRRAGGVTGRRR